MEQMHEIDNRIKSVLLSKANEIQPSEETFTKIITSIEKKKIRKIFYTGDRKYIAALVFTVFLIFGATFTFSGNARATAMEIINNFKTVFILDANNKVVEKPATEAFIRPAVSLTSNLSDADLSKKFGVKICFPQTLNEDYTLQYKAEAVGFNKPLNYDTYESLQGDVIRAINDKEVFASLKKYQPYKSAGSAYKDNNGVTIYIALYNKIITLPVENINFTETIQTKVGDLNAKWLSVSYPDYGTGDMTQKPMGELSAHLLMWSKDNSTYEIMLKGDVVLSMGETIKIAEAFMNAQK